MTARREQFTVAERPAVVLRLASGSARLLEGQAGHVIVEIEGRDPERFTVEQVGDRVLVEQPSGVLRWGRYDVVVTAPAGVRLEAHVATADVDAAVQLGSLTANVASGELHVGDVSGDVRVKSASGDVRLGDVGGELDVTTASGDVRVGAVAGAIGVSTASGGCQFAAAADVLDVRSASGDVVVRRFDGSDLRAKSMSGDVRIGFPPGRTLEVDLSTISGSVRNTFGLDASGSSRNNGGTRVRVNAHTVSGDIVLDRAPG
jgi:DUF4097 and DUF4098 domain-containing protein YvlB